VSLTDDQVVEWAGILLDAADRGTETSAVTASVPDLSVDDAYRVQLAQVDARVARGERIVGAKLGLTSRAKQVQMGVDEPIFGWMFDGGGMAPDEPVVVADHIHPRCEPELVFVLGEDLAGPGITAHDVLDATTVVVGGIEVIDSRYEAFSFTLPDVIADNTSACRHLVGTSGIAPRSADLTLLGCVFDVDGVTVSSAAGAALLGDPATCVAMLADHVGRMGRVLEAGWPILAGSLTDAVALQPGRSAIATYSGLGSVALRAA